MIVNPRLIVLRQINKKFFVYSSNKSSNKELLKPQHIWTHLHVPISIERKFDIMHTEWNTHFLTLFYMKKQGIDNVRNDDKFSNIKLSESKITETHKFLYSEYFKAKESIFKEDMIQLFGIYL